MKPERFTAAVFIFVLAALVLLVSCGVVAGTKKLMDPSQKEKNIEWAKIYPFEGGGEETITERFSPLVNFYEYVKSRMENYTSKEMPFYYRLVEASKTYEDTLGWNMVSVFDYNAVVRLKDGYLTDYTTSRDVVHDAECTKMLADFCAERGIDFAYINFPFKVCQSEDKDISGLLDFANQNADKLLAMLKESGVRNYDFRERLHGAGMKHHESFYITDHHWKTETGLWAAGEILGILRDDFGWNVNPEVLKPENFRYEIYRDWFLGAQGKKVTLARTKPEDFTMIYPKFDTLMGFEVPTLGINVSGDFSILYDMKELESADYYNKNPYFAYVYGDRAVAGIDNRAVTNGKKLMLIKDSFSDCVIPFVALGVQHVDVLDPRYFTGSIKRFIEDKKPDAVIVEYNANVPGRFARPVEENDEKFYDFR